MKPLQVGIVKLVCLENQQLALADLQCSCKGRAIAPYSDAMRSMIIMPMSACVEGHIVQGKDDGDAPT